MAFPLPDFDDSDGEGEGTIPDPDVPVENPFVAHTTHKFSANTQKGLQYDPYHLVYSTQSCTVYIARTIVSPYQFFALKSSPFVKRIRNEYTIFKSIGEHPSIISCYDMWVQKGLGFLQLELAPHGSIRQTITSFSEDESWRIFTHIAYALSRIHSMSYMHLDVSPANILQTVAPNDKIVYKLADFGTALKFGDFEEDAEGAGPYVSPEALAFPHSPYEVGAPTDIFSFGVIMFEIVTHRMAPRTYPGYEQLREGKFDLNSVPNSFKIIKDMLNPNPGLRPTADAILKLPKIKKEMKYILSIDMSKKDNVQALKPKETPHMPAIRVPPETPYIERIKPSKRRQIVFDDSDY